MKITALVVCLATAATAAAQAAEPDHRLGVYAEAGTTEHSGRRQGVGVLIPWRGFQRPWLGSLWTGHSNASLGRWSGRYLDGPRRYSVALGLVPSLRMVPARGRARWFLELGVGLMLTDRHYADHDKRQSTRYNFASHLGLGLWLDRDRQHELGVSVQHVSNGGIKRPNPGENFFQLRYAYWF